MPNYSQSVCLTLDPPLQVEGCSIWQLRRAHSNHNNHTSSSQFYTIQDSDDTSRLNGFLLIAMNDDGTPYRRPSSSSSQSLTSLFCLAPSLVKDVVAKPLTKGSIELVEYSSQQQQQIPFTWQTERFPGGGIAFFTNLRKVNEWKNVRLGIEKESDSVQEISLSAQKHFLLDDARLLSEDKLDSVAGFGMQLAFPPVIDMTQILDLHQQQKQEAIYQVSRELVDAAIDCGFFFSVIQHRVGCSSSSSSVTGITTSDSSFISVKKLHGASNRLLDVVRKSFGRSISSPSEGEAEQQAKLTKVTLKSTTGVVKTNFNPVVHSVIELPPWLQFLNECNAGNHREFSSSHLASCHQQEQHQEVTTHSQSNEQQQHQQDLETYFRFGEELAGRMVALLLKGVDPSMTQWPSEQQKASNSKLRDIQPTVISSASSEAAASSSSSSNFSVPRIDPSQFYSLFRAVCYPPSRKGFRDEQNVDQDEEEVIYEEVEEEVEENDDDARSSSTASHKSSNTDDSEQKALYEHTDKTWITILVAGPSLRGLQVVDCDGSTFTNVKIPAPHVRYTEFLSSTTSQQQQEHEDPPTMCFITNIGDASQMVSKGRYVSRTHRARNPRKVEDDDDDDQKEEQHCNCEFCRVSLPLFVEPSSSADGKTTRWPCEYQTKDVQLSFL